MRARLRHALLSPPTAWAAVFLLLALLAVFITGAYWQAAATGPQVQVPMFYDAHYLFPRPWTQEQEAPGVPPPAPVAAVYGDNQISQTFIAGADNLALVALWLAGMPGERVEITLQGPADELYRGTIIIDIPEGRDYRMGFRPLPRVAGKTFHLTVRAPSATVEHPVIVRSIGGDRLGAAVQLNEYSRPGNLELRTYSRGAPGSWWLAAIGEQLLPGVFRVRLRQYKPSLFKGNAFTLLVSLTVVLSGAFLILAPAGRTSHRLVLPWSLVLLLVGFLGWQAVSGRAILSRPDIGLEPRDGQPITPAPPPGITRLVDDYVLTLWTAVREPEARFVEARWQENEARVDVPVPSRVTYPLTVPPGARFWSGLRLSGSGAGGARFSVWIGDTKAEEVVIEPAAGVSWIEVDLAPWVGKATFLSLVAEGGAKGMRGAWIRPQLTADGSWLLASVPREDPAFRDATFGFGDAIKLHGYALSHDDASLGVRLYWGAERSVEDNAKVFVHLLDAAGEIISQSDSVPVVGTYPLPAWAPGMVVVDEHHLDLPAELPAGSTLAVGLYDPGSGTRWPASDSQGTRLADDRVLLSVAIERAGTAQHRLATQGGLR